MTTKRDVLRDAFGQAAPKHFEWQTEAPFVSERERELVRNAFLPLGERVLDLGCGEGATLWHLGAPAGAVGVDLFEDKVRFAAEKMPQCRFIAASATELPFGTQSFDHVLVRDVVHHIERPEELINECARVLEPGGRIDVLEPCRYNPLIFLHAVTKPEERGELRSTPQFIEHLLSNRFTVQWVRRYQALPIHRLVFHPDMGKPALANDSRVRQAVEGIEAIADRFFPTLAFAYIHVRAVMR